MWDGSLSMDYSEPPEESERFATRELAEAHADREAAECVILEGGIQVIPRDEQARALAAQISELAGRLDSLLTSGIQWEPPGEGS